MTELLASCTVCQHPQLETVIDFGEQPPANRFMTASAISSEQVRYPLALGFCQSCGTAQLSKRMPIEAIRPRFNWLLYNEPERHLDESARQIANLPGIHSGAQVLGITYKDQTTIDRLKNLGITQGVCLSDTDFPTGDSFFGLETIQKLLQSPEMIQYIVSKYGQSDIVLMRHVIEHAESASQLIHHLRPLLKTNGYLIMELPDSEKIFKSSLYPFIWEEHMSYFTEQSIYQLANLVSARVAWFQRNTYPYEDSLMVAFTFAEEAEQAHRHEAQNNLSDASHILNQLKNNFETSKQHWRTTLKAYLNQGKKIAVFGAGHLSAKFINFYELNDLVSCVIDDNTNKVGMTMPGSLLPIVPSSELSSRNITVCISTLNPESDAKVREKLASYLNEGGLFISAFSGVNG